MGGNPILKKIILTTLTMLAVASFAAAGPADEALNNAQSLFDRGDFQDAANAAAEGLAVDPEHFKLIRISGQIQYQLGQYIEALKFFEKALTKKGKDPDVLYGAGMAALKTGAYKEAAGYFETGVKTGKMKSRFLCGLGIAQTELGNYSEADINLRKAIDKDKNVPEFHLALAEENYRNKVYSIAINEFFKAIELDSSLEKTVPDLYYKVGESHLNLQNVLKAIEFYKKGLDLFPDDITAWKKLARICEVADKWADAVFCIENVVRINPSDGEWWARLGVAFVKTNKPEK